MPTTPRGIPYPDPDANLIEYLAPDLAALAEGADDAMDALLTAIFGAVRPKIQYGQRIINIASAASGTTALTFATPYTTTPIVVASCATATTTYIGTASGVTTTGCNLVGFHRDGTSGTVTLAVNFIAIGV